jgi:hypothetical protein
MAVATDYSSSEDFDLQPFYKAGSIEVHKWLHRTRGENIRVSSYIDNINEDIKNSDNYIVQGYSTSGMAGVNLYQLQAQIVSVKDGQKVTAFGISSLKFATSTSTK